MKKVFAAKVKKVTYNEKDAWATIEVETRFCNEVELIVKHNETFPGELFKVTLEPISKKEYSKLAGKAEG